MEIGNHVFILFTLNVLYKNQSPKNPHKTVDKESINSYFSLQRYFPSGALIWLFVLFLKDSFIQKSFTINFI